MLYKRILVAGALLIFGFCCIWVYSHKHPLVSEWNQFEQPSRVVTEITQTVKNLNSDGRARDIQALLKTVYSQLDLDSYSTRDKERLCKLYDKYNLGRQLRGCYRDVINSELSQGELKAWIRVLKKQLEYNESGNDALSFYDNLYDSLVGNWYEIDTSKNDQVLVSLDAAPTENMDEQDHYQIAKTLLKYRYQLTRAKRMLADLISASSDVNLISKAYFVLARHEIAEKNYKAAFRIYSDYINKFENTKRLAFFVSKAHQRLLQLSALMGSEVDVERSKAALIAHTADTSDLRSYFDVARKLSDQGLMHEAKSLYLLGINRIQASDQDYTLYQRVRLYAEVIRTGNDIGIDYEIHDGYIKKVDSLLEYGLHVQLDSNEKLRYLHSQYLLWAADAYRMHEQLKLANSYFGRFIATYPDSPDYELAVYKFLRVCVQIQCNDKDDLISVSMPISLGNWSKTAIGTFSSLMADIRKPAWRGEIERWIN